MCGVMAEYATSLYLDKLGIRHTATIMSHAKGFNQDTYALPDFEIWQEGKRVFLEVKSTQLAMTAKYFRMLTPAHALSYQKKNSLVVFCATDIE